MKKPALFAWNVINYIFGEVFLNIKPFNSTQYKGNAKEVIYNEIDH